MKSNENYDNVMNGITLFDNNQIQSNGLWTVKNVADYLKCSIGHVYNLVSDNKIPYKKLGALLRFLPQEIIDWVNEEGGF